MITLDVSITGGQIANKIAQDPEELWYFLKELAEYDNGEIHSAVAEYANGLDAGAAVIFLRNLANAIEEEMG